MNLSRRWKRSRGLFPNAPRPLPGRRAPRQRAAGPTLPPSPSPLPPPSLPPSLPPLLSPSLTPSRTSLLSPLLPPSLSPSLSPSLTPLLPPSLSLSLPPMLRPSLPPWLLLSPLLLLAPELPSCKRPESSGDDGCRHSVDEATAEEEIDIRSRCSTIEFNEGKGSNQKYLVRKGMLWREQREMTVQVKEEHCGDFGAQTTAVFRKCSWRMCELSSLCSRTCCWPRPHIPDKYWPVALNCVHKHRPELMRTKYRNSECY